MSERPALGFYACEWRGSEMIVGRVAGMAERAGVVPGDRVVSIDGKSPLEFLQSQWWPRQAPITVEAIRDGAPVSLTIMFDPATPDRRVVSMEVCPAARQIGFAGTVDRWPYSIARDGVAAAAGILPHDRITGIGVVDRAANEVELTTWEEFASEALQWDSIVCIEFERGERRHQVDIVVRPHQRSDDLLQADTPVPFDGLAGWQRDNYVQHLVTTRKFSPGEAELWLRDALAEELRTIAAELMDADIAQALDKNPDPRNFVSNWDPFREVSDLGGASERITPQPIDEPWPVAARRRGFYGE